MLKGTGASEGIGIGTVMRIEEVSLEYTPKQVEDPEQEIQRFQNAVREFIQETEAQAEALKASAGEKEAEIMMGHVSMIQDPYMTGEAERLIREGQCAEAAFESVSDMFINMFANVEDEMMRQRAADIRDIKSGVLAVLLGVKEVKVSDAPAGTILLARELTPSVTAGINKDNIVGIITETGGKTSHSAILARALEIPAVLSVENATEILKNGDFVIVDGRKGDVITEPDGETVKAYTEKREKFLQERRELEQYRGKTTVNANGTEYELVCNIGKPQDAEKVVAGDGEGVGLFRTEFLFMDRDAMPTEEEQFEAYKRRL